eukprot:149994-Chlamydomonas_euryale.AAC.4
MAPRSTCRRACRWEVRRLACCNAAYVGHHASQPSLTPTTTLVSAPVTKFFILGKGVCLKQQAVAQISTDRLPACWPALAVQAHIGTNPDKLTDSVVRVKSLPFAASQLDIIRFFKDYRLKANGVQVGRGCAVRLPRAPSASPLPRQCCLRASSVWWPS